MNDLKAVRKVLSLASFFITAPHNSSATRKIERSKISALIVVVGDASAALDGSDVSAALDGSDVSAALDGDDG